jgi:hypothetical protein
LGREAITRSERVALPPKDDVAVRDVDVEPGSPTDAARAGADDGTAGDCDAAGAGLTSDL